MNVDSVDNKSTHTYMVKVSNKLIHVQECKFNFCFWRENPLNKSKYLV